MFISRLLLRAISANSWASRDYLGHRSEPSSNLDPRVPLDESLTSLLKRTWVRFGCQVSYLPRKLPLPGTFARILTAKAPDLLTARAPLAGDTALGTPTFLPPKLDDLTAADWFPPQSSPCRATLRRGAEACRPSPFLPCRLPLPGASRSIPPLSYRRSSPLPGTSPRGGGAFAPPPPRLFCKGNKSLDSPNAKTQDGGGRGHCSGPMAIAAPMRPSQVAAG